VEGQDIFRKNVHLNPTTANIDTVVFSKAKRKRAFNAKCQASIDAANASVKKQKEDKATDRKLRAHMKAVSTTAFIKKVAVDTCIAETNEFVTHLDLLEKMVQGSTVQKLSVHKFEQLSQRAVFQESTTVVDLGRDSSSSDDEELVVDPSSVIMPHSPHHSSIQMSSTDALSSAASSIIDQCEQSNSIVDHHSSIYSSNEEDNDANSDGLTD
jgi:hypothetical protein